MKAKINGIEIEGDVNEFKKLLNLETPTTPKKSSKLKNAGMTKTDEIYNAWVEKQKTNKDISISHVAKELGYKLGGDTYNYFRKKGVKIKNYRKKRKKQTYKVWTTTELNTLIKEYHMGNSDGKVAKLLNRTKSSVNGMKWRLIKAGKMRG